MSVRFSVNNRLIVEPYHSDRALKATAGSGFALVSQKVNLKGLKLLVGASIFENGHEIYWDAGAIVYIREELLYTQPWAKHQMECEGIEGKFIIVDRQFVEMIER